MQISTPGKLNNPWAISGFSLVELIVVMFILSVLAFLTLPVFKHPGMGERGKTGDSRDLAQFIEALRQKAFKENKDYLLHLDLVSGRAWAGISEADAGTEEANTADTENTKSLESGLSGLSLDRVEFFTQTDREPEDTIIRISHNGTCEMALIHMGTDDGDITLKLHPFIKDVEIIQGNLSVHDCL